MKTCEKCGIEIDTRDGENLCRACDDAAANGKTRKGARKQRNMYHQAMLDCGLVRVKGACGGIYYE